MAPNWVDALAEDPLPWLLEPTEPAVGESEDLVTVCTLDLSPWARQPVLL